MLQGPDHYEEDSLARRDQSDDEARLEHTLPINF
jgi:hypothetical protein